MVAPTTDPAVQELQRQVAGLSSSVNSPTQLDRYLDVNSKKIINDAVNDVLFDSLWKNFYQYNTRFESLDGFSIIGAGVTLDGTSVKLTTAASGTDSEVIAKGINTVGSFDFTKQSRFRTVISIGTSTAQSGALQVGSVAADGYGFTFSNLVLSGTVSVGGATTTKSLNFNLNTSGLFILEAWFYPGTKVDYYVNGVLMGTITSGLPKVSGIILWNGSITESAASAKVLNIYSVDFLQRQL